MGVHHLLVYGLIMPKLGPGDPKSARDERVHEELHKFKHGQLHSGSKTGPVVTNRDQAIAIALSEAGYERKNGKKSKR
jgi:Family of unknown function (DUF6496)